MPSEKKSSKGGFLYLFDWKAKSRKKLFSNKSESSGVSDQGNETVDNLAISKYHLTKLHESEDQSSFRGSGNYGGTSSVNGDDDYRTKPPGLVARLMGLDSMPTTSCEASSYYPDGVAKFQPENQVVDYSKLEDFTWSLTVNRTNQIDSRLSKRFQTEILPPKSAKPISITHHKLLSPIKSPGFVRSNDAAYIMEAASRIIDSSPYPSSRIVIPSLSSPSSSFRLHDLKEKIDAAQRSSRLLVSSKTPKQSPSVLQSRGNSSEGSSSRSLFKNISGSEISCSEKSRNKGKMLNGEEAKQVKLKHKQMSTQKFDERKTPGIKSSCVLRQNNDKQNNVSRKDKASVKTSFSVQQPRKFATGDNSVGPSKIVSRVFVNGENRSKKLVTDKRARFNGVPDKTPSCNKIKNVSRNKQSVVRENIPDNRGHRNSGKDMDVISFTFNSPIKKSATQSLSPDKATGINRHHLGADFSTVDDQAQKRSSISPHSGMNVTDGESLSLLLEQKLKELRNKIVSDTSQKSEDFENVEEHVTNGANKFETRRKSDLVHLNILIPECSISGSCVSSSTTSDFTYGYDQPTSPQSQEVISSISTESIHRREDETDFSDATSHWEVEYVRHVLHYAGLNRFWFDKHYKTIDPAVFDLLENLINTSSRNSEVCSKLDRRILFNFISETVSSRYERVCIGSKNLWAKWEMLLRNDCLTEELFKEIIGFQRMGALMVDEVVDADMSTRCGKWLDFEIESLEEGIEIEEGVIASLIDELVYDMVCT